VKPLVAASAGIRYFLLLSQAKPLP